MNFLKTLFRIGRDADYDHAIDCYNKNLYREAIELFGTVLRKQTSASGLYRNLAHVYTGQAHRNLGIMLFAVGNFSAALQELQESLRFNPDYVEVHHLIGICQNNIGDFTGAVKTFNSILKLDPVNLPIKLKLGVSLHNLKMWDRAVATYAAILQQQPRYADVHFRLGLALLGQGKPAEAIEAFQQALLINPRYIEAHIKLGITQAYCGRFEDALRTFTAIIAAFPDYADIYYYVGIVHAGRNAVDEAIEAFARAVRINPSYKDARIKLGMLYCHRGAYREGLEQLQAASALDTNDAHLQSAIETMQAIVASPDFTEGQMRAALSQCFGGDKPIEQAIQEFNRHIKISPDFSDVLTLVQHFSEDDASVCAMLIPLMTDYLAKYPQYPDVHNALGTLFMKLHKYADAETAFRSALSLNPCYGTARINLFNALRAQHKTAEAIEQTEQLLRDHPNCLYPDVCCAIAEVQLEAGNDAAAQEHISRALQMNPHYCYAHFLQGRLHEQQDDTDKALNAYRRCLACHPSRELAEQAERAVKKLSER